MFMRENHIFAPKEILTLIDCTGWFCSAISKTVLAKTGKKKNCEKEKQFLHQKHLQRLSNRFFYT